MPVQSIPQIGNFEAASLPQLMGEPVEDYPSLAWRATDSDGITYWGQSALDIERQFAAELIRLAVCVSDGDPRAVTERCADREMTDAQEMEEWL